MGVVALIDFLITAFFGQDKVPHNINRAMIETPGAMDLASEIKADVPRDPAGAARKICKLAEAIHPKLEK